MTFERKQPFDLRNVNQRKKLTFRLLETAMDCIIVTLSECESGSVIYEHNIHNITFTFFDFNFYNTGNDRSDIEIIAYDRDVEKYYDHVTLNYSVKKDCEVIFRSEQYVDHNEVIVSMEDF